MYKEARWVRKWIAQIVDPVWAINGVLGYWRFFFDWYRYSQIPNVESIRLADTYPQVHDRTHSTPFDSHYFYVNGWAMRRIVINSPRRHVDIGSQTMFVNLLAAVVPVTFLDYRPLEANLYGFSSICGSILALPFADCSVESLPCLHVAEHIGLGRYGDSLDPQGTKKAAMELARVIAPGGNLFFAIPIGKPRLCFNAHRIHAAETILEYFAELELVEFSGVHDDGRFVEDVDHSEFKDSIYACGMFRFRKAHRL